jgi:hypothetical protein
MGTLAESHYEEVYEWHRRMIVDSSIQSFRTVTFRMIGRMVSIASGACLNKAGTYFC